MADFTAGFVGTTGGPFASSIDPFDFAANFSPFVYVADVAPPVVTIESPAGGSLGRTAPVVALIQDLVLLKLTYVWVEYPSGEWELAYARGRFSRRFRRSTLVDVQVGLSARLTLVREGGWPYGSLTLKVDGIDGAGNAS